MSARSKARKRALDVLFECEARGLPFGATLDDRRADAAADRRSPPVAPYTEQIVLGVAEHQQQIDALISQLAHGWELDRMPAVDRNVLRVGVYELLWSDEIPDAVAVSEAVTLVTDLSTDESPGFVNGLLARVVTDRDSILADLAAADADPG